MMRDFGYLLCLMPFFVWELQAPEQICAYLEKTLEPLIDRLEQGQGWWR